LVLELAGVEAEIDSGRIEAVASSLAEEGIVAETSSLEMVLVGVNIRSKLAAGDTEVVNSLERRH
jgi:hypothetical protein